MVLVKACRRLTRTSCVLHPLRQLPPKPAEQSAVDVALGEGGALLGIQVGAVVLVGGLGAGVRQVQTGFLV